MSTASEQYRLAQYYDFDPSVTERVSEVAKAMRTSSLASIQESLPETRFYQPFKGKPIEVLDIIPDDYDGTYVYHLPMGNALDANMTIRIAALATAEPTKRIISIGNPGSPGKNNTGKVRAGDARSVWNGDFRAVIDPALQYLHHERIEDATHIGFSYGADKAAASAQYAERYDQQVTQGVLMEPASVANRGLLKLAGDFMSTGKALDGYVQASNCEAYIEARTLADKRGHGLVGYGIGLARLSNIAIGHALAQDGFEDRVDNALTSQPEMNVDIIWGSESELALRSLIVGVASRITAKHGQERVRTMELEGQKHAMGDDIFLHTALVLQATQQ